MQVILGSGGAIGKDLARELKKYDEKVRLFSRKPQKVNGDDELFRGDLMHKPSVEKALKGAGVAYLTAGLPYQASVWEKQWPVIMQNVISACKKNRTKLVFFDNMYLYNPEKLSPMTEETEIKPKSRKGKVRARISRMLLDEMERGKIEGLIARAADFYGPGIANSLFNEAVLKKLRIGKNATWFCSARFLHNFTFTPDAAKATALLGNTESAYGQVWHLPTAEPMPMKEWIDIAGKTLDVPTKIIIVPVFLVRLMSLFSPLMKEMLEMMYQYNRDYDFDSSKFETVFKTGPTPVTEAMKEVVFAR